MEKRLSGSFWMTYTRRLSNWMAPKRMRPEVLSRGMRIMAI